MNWKTLAVPKFELDIATLLRSGQAFRWRNIEGIWSCALNNQIVLLREIRSDDDHVIEFTQINADDPQIKQQLDTGEFLHSYFNLDCSTNQLYQHWGSVDKHFPTFHNVIKKEVLETPPASERQTPIETETFKGVRILYQDPWETLISFIISSNNNIKRISQLCEVLCISYGNHIKDYNGIPYYTFPQPREFFKNAETVTNDHKLELESELRSLGFGYRAKYIMKTVSAMLESPKLFETLYMGDAWKTDEECIDFLTQFDGVGPKVADCVALMGCRRDDLVPVDTHVWNVLRNNYRNEFNIWVDKLDDDEFVKFSKSTLKKMLGNKAVDVKVYPYVKQFFKDYWVEKAGWAQAVVFSGIVKLDNGINHVDDIQKLLAKVSESKGEKQPAKKAKRS